jgi:hypothetical protein
VNSGPERSAIIGPHARAAAARHQQRPDEQSSARRIKRRGGLAGKHALAEVLVGAGADPVGRLRVQEARAAEGETCRAERAPP